MLARYVNIKIPRVSRRIGLAWYYWYRFLHRLTKRWQFDIKIRRGVHPCEGYPMDYLYVPAPVWHRNAGFFKAFFKKGHYAKQQQQTD